MTATTLTAPQLDYAALDRILEKTKGRLFFNKTGCEWVAALICDHKYVWDLTCKTAWCNGITIGINPTFFIKLPWEERVTLLAHESSHTMYDHFDRMGDRDPKIWNYAADYVINNDLDRMKFSFAHLGGLLDHRYDNMSTEQVYDMLWQDPDARKMIQDKQFPGNSMAGDGSTIEPDELPDMCGDLRPADPDTRPERMAKVIKAQQVALAGNQAGSIPGEITQMIEAYLNPVLPWHVLLYRYFNERNADDYSWKRPNRRSEDIYLPSMISDNGLEHLMYFFDVSGSVTDDQERAALGELVSLHTSIRPERITLMTFDDVIQNTYDFYQDDILTKIEITGRGGTDLEPVYDAIVKAQPAAAVVFSDLDCEPMEDPGIPVIWIVLDNPDVTPDFGSCIHLDTSQLK